MHYPFLVADPFSGLHYRLTDTRLAELSLAPKAIEWSSGRAIAEGSEAIWFKSFANAPFETMSGALRRTSLRANGKKYLRNNTLEKKQLAKQIGGF